MHHNIDGWVELFLLIIFFASSHSRICSVFSLHPFFVHSPCMQSISSPLRSPRGCYATNVYDVRNASWLLWEFETVDMTSLIYQPIRLGYFSPHLTSLLNFGWTFSLTLPFKCMFKMLLRISAIFLCKNIL